jgi:rubrerythrin
MKMSTMDNLKEAFAGESQANRKYLAFAKKADAEGHTQIAKLFRAAADAETVHAHAHLRVMDGINSTEENLKAAIEGETEEFEEMYPGFIEEAKAEDNTAAVITFENANAVEKIHAELYKKALENMGNNEEVDYYVCQVCGNTVENQAPEKCPICGVPASKFIKID